MGKKQNLIINLKCPTCHSEISAEVEIEPKTVGSITAQEETVK
jgi:hypothetical protein